MPCVCTLLQMQYRHTLEQQVRILAPKAAGVELLQQQLKELRSKVGMQSAFCAASKSCRCALLDVHIAQLCKAPAADQAVPELTSCVLCCSQALEADELKSQLSLMRSETTQQRAAGNTQFNAAVSNLGLAPEMVAGAGADAETGGALLEDEAGSGPPSPQHPDVGRMSSTSGDWSTAGRRSMQLARGPSLPRASAAGAAAPGPGPTQFSHALASLGIGPEMQRGFTINAAHEGVAAGASSSPPQHAGQPPTSPTGLHPAASSSTSTHAEVASPTSRGAHAAAATDVAAARQERSDAAADAAEAEAITAAASTLRLRAEALRAELLSDQELQALRGEVDKLEQSTKEALLLKKTVTDLRALAGREEQMRNDLQVRFGLPTAC